MNFFEQQDKARGLSSYLFFLFGIAVVCIIISIFCVASLAVGFERNLAELAWTFELAVISSTVTIIAILIASTVRISWLSQGGKVIAESMGGQKLNQNTRDPLCRQILNVVEEMAIASGTPVPPVYLMNEEGINAFAAGYSPRDAVIGVTKGCATKLNRDQLQGVMAHEFSHILNGDMRINIRLTGIIFGIVFLASIGRILTNIGYLSGGRRRGGKDGGGGGVIVMLGIGLLIIGGIGGFFGAMIRASISRQREFLADASAVQFTRNPDGIAGALKRIGGYSHGSKLKSAGAQEFSHMFFSSGISSMFATHPPLPIRIKRIDPSWKNIYPKTDQISESASHGKQRAAISGFTVSSSHPRGTEDQAPTQKSAKMHKRNRSAQSFLKNEAKIDREKIAHVRSLISSIPNSLLKQAKEPFDARCILFGLLLDNQNLDARKRQIQMIEQQTEEGTVLLTERVEPLLSKLSCEQKLILVEETRPAITELSMNQFSVFQTLIIQLIGADESVDLFEWCLHKVIEFDFGKKHYPRQLHGRASLRSRLPECSVILGALAHHGQDGADPKPSFVQGMQSLDRSGQFNLPDKKDCGLSSMDKAIEKLNRMSATEKRSLINACARTIDHDGKTTDVEIQILRGIACALSCPLGPNL